MRIAFQKEITICEIHIGHGIRIVNPLQLEIMPTPHILAQPLYPIWCVQLNFQIAINPIDLPEYILLLHKPVIGLDIYPPIPLLLLVLLLDPHLLSHICLPAESPLHPVLNLGTILSLLKGIAIIMHIELTMHENPVQLTHVELRARQYLSSEDFDGGFVL